MIIIPFIILLIGIPLFILLPFRIKKIVNLLKSWNELSLISKSLGILIALIFLSCCLIWFYVFYAILMFIIHFKDGIWGISEIGMSLTVYVIFYGFLELLFLAIKHLRD